MDITKTEISSLKNVFFKSLKEEGRRWLDRWTNVYLFLRSNNVSCPGKYDVIV